MYKASTRALLAAVLFITLATILRAQGTGYELANMREDVRLLVQRMNEMQLRVEQLEKENQELRARANSQNLATVAQLNEAVADLNRAIRSANNATKTETLQQVSAQIEKLAVQTNAAIDSLAKGVNANRSPIAAPTFTDDYPREGVTYTVQKGDSLASIAKKTGATPRDIINANKLADPSRIQAGQTLFIPGGK